MIGEDVAKKKSIYTSVVIIKGKDQQQVKSEVCLLLAADEKEITPLVVLTLSLSGSLGSLALVFLFFLFALLLSS